MVKDGGCYREGEGDTPTPFSQNSRLCPGGSEPVSSSDASRGTRSRSVPGMDFSRVASEPRSEGRGGGFS